MKSPFTGGNVILLKEPIELEFRNVRFQIIQHIYQCVDTGERFSDTKLDELNTNQIYNQYRELESIPFPDEIKKYREKYGISAVKMSEILGFGVNMYAKYENGDIPNVSNGRMIKICEDAKAFKSFFEKIETNKFSETERENILKRINKAIENEKDNRQKKWDIFLAFGKVERNIFTGYVTPSLEKARQMILFFAKSCMPFTTKMNKLLFYADFLMYGTSGSSISGISYVAITNGPVPQDYEVLFKYASNIVDRQEIFYNEDISGERFVPIGDFDPSVFSEDEFKILQVVADRFYKTSTKEIVEISHKEDAWIENEKERKLIPYKYAFSLKGIDVK